MLTIPPALQAKLDSGVTTLARCWLITRNDGLIQGFTDHDADILLGDIPCRAAAGLSASEANAQLGLAVAGGEIAGALSDDTLTEADLAAGRYDAAAVEIWLVDWSEPTLKVKLQAGVLGEVRRKGSAFTAELRGLAHRLAENNGRLFTASCNADLGDTRCGIDLGAAEFQAAGSIIAVTATSAFRASGLGGHDDGWFTAGRLEWTAGANAGLAVEVKSHRVADGHVTVELWQAMPEPLAYHDEFTVTAGCDKHFATCRAKFDNAVNFRGFPHIPGNDFVISYPNPGTPGNDGGILQS